jgi:serine protease Do
MIAGAGAGKAGFVVISVDLNGAAADHGFKEDDVILEVAGKSVANPGDVRSKPRARTTRTTF